MRKEHRSGGIDIPTCRWNCDWSTQGHSRGGEEPGFRKSPWAALSRRRGAGWCDFAYSLGTPSAGCPEPGRLTWNGVLVAQVHARQLHGRPAVEGSWGGGAQRGEQPALGHSEEQVLTLLGLLLHVPAQGLHPLQFSAPQEQGQGEGLRADGCDIVGCAGHLLGLLGHQDYGGDSQLGWERCGQRVGAKWGPGGGLQGEWGLLVRGSGEDPAATACMSRM